MRFSLAIAGLLAGAATAAVADASVNAALAGIDAKVDVGLDAEVNVDAKVAIARKAAAGFKCSSGMSYCPWTKACACPPGLKLDRTGAKCVGRALSGAWPKPRTDVYASKGVNLVAYCAISPYKIVRYNHGHEYCQVGLRTIVFVASVNIEIELAAYVDIEIDVKANISADLKAVVAGLAGLYLESVVDAVVLFNTNALGLATVRADVSVDVSLGLLGNVKDLFCAAGMGKCNFDCVSYCTKGCKNYIDVGADVGAQLEGIVGLCILPNVVLIVNSAHVIVTVAVDGLLCLIGSLLKRLLGLFGCNCA